MISFTVAITLLLSTLVIGFGAGFFFGQKYALRDRSED